MICMENSLLCSSIASAIKEIKNQWRFWIKLMFKLILIAMAIMIPLMFGFAGAFLALLSMAKTLMGYAWIQQVFTAMGFRATIESVLNMTEAPLIGYLALSKVALLIVSIIVIFVSLYYLVSYSLAYVANTIDVATGQAPRGMVRVKRILRFLPVFIIPSLMTISMISNHSLSLMFYFAAVALCFVKYYLFGSRLSLAMYFMIDEGSNFFTSIKQSWKATSGKGLAVFSFGFYFLVNDLLALLIQQSLLPITLRLFIYFAWLLLNPIALMAFTYGYAALKRA